MNIESISLRKVDSILFFSRGFTPIILDCLNIFGVNFIKSLESDINKSVLPLEKKLQNLSILNIPYIKNLSEHLISICKKPSVSQIYDIQKCLLLFEVLAYVKEDKQSHRFNGYEEYKKYQEYNGDIVLREFLSENKNVKSIETFLNNICKYILFLVGGNDYKIEDHHIENALKNKKEQWVKIIGASVSVKNHPIMKAVYCNLVSLALLEKGISDFLHDLDQEHPVGRTVAAHNQE